MAIEQAVAPYKLPHVAGIFDFGDVRESQHHRFRRIGAACAIILFAVTWRLWIPQTVYPQVPLIRMASNVPSWLAWMILAVVALAMATLLAGKKRSHIQLASATLAIGLVAMFLIDQHRLQPWAYEFAIIGLVMATCGYRFTFRCLRVITISIYVFSALGKLDYEFTHTTGQQFLYTLQSLVGLDSPPWPETARYVIVVLFPVMELLIAASLCWQRSRRVGVVIACVFHAMLVLLLGPLGLGHQPAVLIWNLFFMAKVVLLFGLENRPYDASPLPVGRERWVGLAVAMLALWPLLEPWGYIDHWLAWGLYSPRNSRATLFLSAGADVPGDLAGYLKPARNGYQEFDLGQWSIDTLSVPIYPQDRFQIGVSLAVIDRLERNVSIRVVWQGMSGRDNGQRSVDVLTRTDRVRMTAEKFFFNAFPNQNLDSS